MGEAHADEWFPHCWSAALEAMTTLLADTAELPHIVVTHNRTQDRREHYGPYSTAIEAFEAGEVIRAELVREFCGQDYVVSVAPLLAWSVAVRHPARRRHTS